jgi:hypothetical protein
MDHYTIFVMEVLFAKRVSVSGYGGKLLRRGLRKFLSGGHGGYQRTTPPFYRSAD